MLKIWIGDQFPLEKRLSINVNLLFIQHPLYAQYCSKSLGNYQNCVCIVDNDLQTHVYRGTDDKRVYLILLPENNPQWQLSVMHCWGPGLVVGPCSWKFSLFFHSFLSPSFLFSLSPPFASFLHFFPFHPLSLISFPLPSIFPPLLPSIHSSLPFFLPPFFSLNSLFEHFAQNSEAFNPLFCCPCLYIIKFEWFSLKTSAKCFLLSHKVSVGSWVLSTSSVRPC